MIEGIDVSAAQANVDWDKVAAAGAKFVVAKATQGTSYVDSTFTSHVRGARKAGLLAGAYHYLDVRHGAPQDAAAQADHFCDVYLAVGCDLRPALDCEPTNNAGATPEEWHEAIHAWIDRVRERLGCDPILYTFPSFWEGLGKLLAGDEELAKLDLWIAHYTTAPQPIVPPPWKEWTAWQYAADEGVVGRIDGIGGHVDRDKLRGELSAWAKPAPVQPAQPPADPPVASQPVEAVQPPDPSLAAPAVTPDPLVPVSPTGWSFFDVIAAIGKWIARMFFGAQAK